MPIKISIPFVILVKLIEDIRLPPILIYWTTQYGILPL